MEKNLRNNWSFSNLRLELKWANQSLQTIKMKKSSNQRWFTQRVLYFCELGAHAQFSNPTTTPSGILVTAERKKEERKKINSPKIVAYLSCSAGRTDFARTKISLAPPKGAHWEHTKHISNVRGNLNVEASHASCAYNV